MLQIVLVLHQITNVTSCPVTNSPVQLPTAGVNKSAAFALWCMLVRCDPSFLLSAQNNSINTKTAIIITKMRSKLMHSTSRRVQKHVTNGSQYHDKQQPLSKLPIPRDTDFDSFIMRNFFVCLVRRYSMSTKQQKHTER